MLNNKQITVVRVRPNESPEVITIEKSLKSYQREVDGLIQVIYPFEDEVGIILNEEGKILGLPPNRGLYDADGLADIFMGTFLIVGCTDDDFCSLTEEQIKAYTLMYKHIEQFNFTEDNVEVSIKGLPFTLTFPKDRALGFWSVS